MQYEMFGEGKELSWRERYNAVINSPRWKKLRARFCKEHDNKCQRCKWQKAEWDKSRKLELHHLTYDRLGAELDTDLELLCSACHVMADRERAIASRQRASDALHEAQFDGWVSEVYGEMYVELYEDWMYEKFIDWLERKRDYD
jgi:hypothetical protein